MNPWDFLLWVGISALALIVVTFTVALAIVTVKSALAQPSRRNSEHIIGGGN